MPELDAQGRAETLNGMWQNLGRNIGEYPKLETMLRQGCIRFEGQEHLQKDKGGFIIGAHLGNWGGFGDDRPLSGSENRADLSAA